MKKVIIAALIAATILPQALSATARFFSRDALDGDLPAQATAINNYQIGATSPMSTANALFGR